MDWFIGPPDFVGVGAQRSGTTWWHRLLCDHPGVQVASEKEFHFFDGYFGREFLGSDAQAYHRLFPRPRDSLTGEWCPRYMHDFWTPALLSRAAPRAKILVLLRDPLGRYQSGLSREVDVLRRSVRGGDRPYVDVMCARDALSRSLYGRQLERLLEHFDRRQVLVLQLEACIEDPAAQLRRTYEFLGIDPVAHVPGFLTEHRGRSHPQIRLPGAVVAAATDMILHDAAKLKALVPEIDLELWPSCRELASESRLVA